jgi:hypothetical protein
MRHFRWVSILLMVLGCLQTFALSLATADEPWINLVLSIDGKSYIRGMRSMIEQGAILDVDNLYHSPGFQIYLAFLWRLWPWSNGFFFFVKLVSLALYIASIAMVVQLGSRLVDTRVGLLAGILLSLSPKLQVYVNLLQGEVLQAFLFTLLAWLSARAAAGPRQKTLILALVMSVIMTALILLQVRFLPILLFLPWLFPACPDTRRRQVAAALVTPAVVLLTLWSGYHSLKRNELVMVGTGTAFRIKTAYNPNATGAAYPYPKPAEPTGLDFIASHPHRVLWLVGQRFQYLWDLKPDEWYLGNPVLCKARSEIVPTSYDGLLYGLALGVFLLGLAASWLQVSRAGTLGLWGVVYAILLSILLGPLLVFASSRFLIPAIPMLAILQALALVRCFDLAVSRNRGS